MQPTTETDDYIEYVGDGKTYRFTKTVPLIFTITMDHSNPRFSSAVQTWQEAKAAMESLDNL